MNAKKALINFLKDRFNLDKNKEGYEEIIETIRKNIYFRGTNLWILVFAIFIASIGLNVNSTAVIIGAMLISPLMGPIMGIGLGAGIYDFRLIRLSAYNFLVAIIISLVTSALYFLVSPLYEAHSELLARTTPTVYDVFIAFFGGLAGIIATSTKEKGNVIPGVAIATALMPPLCTAGYGLAVGNVYFFLGAIYLFFINSVFICLGTYLIVRFLRFPKRQYSDLHTEKRMRLVVYVIVTITFVPSVIIAYFMIQRNIFETDAANFVIQEMSFPGNTIIEKTIDPKKRTIDVVYVGQGISPELVENAKRKLPNYHLKNTNVNIRQGIKEMTASDITSMKSQIVEELYRKNQEVLVSKDEKIALLEKELMKYASEPYSGEILREIQALMPGLEEVSVMKTLLSHPREDRMDTVYLAYLEFSKPPDRKEVERFETWLRERLKGNNVKVIVSKK